jgi:hypothetical protein
MITTDVAYRMRFRRGLELPSMDDDHYEDDRVRRIAVRQAELNDELDDLDDQLRQIYKEYCNDDSRKSE